MPAGRLHERTDLGGGLIRHVCSLSRKSDGQRMGEVISREVVKRKKAGTESSTRLPKSTRKALLAYFKEMGREPNEARMRMARIPMGASLIDNPVSKAPGFQNAPK